MSGRREFLSHFPSMIGASLVAPSISYGMCSEPPAIHDKTSELDSNLVRTCTFLSFYGIKYQILSDNVLVVYPKMFDFICDALSADKTQKIINEICEAEGIYGIHFILLPKEIDLSVSFDNKKIIISMPTQYPASEDDVKYICESFNVIRPWIMNHDWKVVCQYDKNIWGLDERDTLKSGDPNIGEVVWMEKRFI